MSSAALAKIYKLVREYLDEYQLLEDNPDVKPADIESFFNEVEYSLFGKYRREKTVTSTNKKAFPSYTALSKSSESVTEYKRNISKVVVYSDGASKGNPGDAGAGFVVIDADGRELKKGSRYLGKSTNNIAEYLGAIMGLECAHELGARDVLLRADSELMVKQLNGIYRVKNQGLKPLYEQLMDIKGRFHSFRVEHVPRAQNAKADRLASGAANRN